MKKHDQIKLNKKKDPDVKTFPVPSDLEDIKKEGIISLNTISNDSKEQIINHALKLHSQGKILEASKYYQYIINQGFQDHRVFSNYGVILKNLGKLKEAELSLRKAIELMPNFEEAYYNLGNVLNDLGKAQEAFDSHLKVIEINPIFPNIYTSLVRLIKDLNLSLLNKSKLEDILNILLERDNVPHNELLKAFYFLYRKEIIINLEGLESDFSKIELVINKKIIINALKKMILKDLRLEKSLTKIREKLCNMISTNKNINCSQLEFLIALAEQCFLNEYIYSLSKEENISINIILKKCRDGELNETNISILSCYFPLYKLLNQIPLLKSFNSSNKSIIELIKSQISEPLKEIQLSKSIKKLGNINEITSQIVKSQYEDNPYPKWKFGNESQALKTNPIIAINAEIKPNSLSSNFNSNQLRVLIAGCGTGLQILDAQRYKDSKITGIDLSLPSLAYAQRKINELKSNNVELIQMDILEVDLLEEKFDIIESSGVLHHMDDPLKGLKALLCVLKNNGFLKLGLYSELARTDIIKARDYISTNNLHPNDEDIKGFREDVFSGKIEQLNNLKNWGDFFTTSACRDLCFHTQEHRFTINQLQETLRSNELEFLGFLLPKPVKSVYEQYFPEDQNQTNLQNWAKFEERHPNTFRAMYQFWVCKMKR